MNVRRGLFRVWIFLTGLWVLIVAAFAYENLSDPYIPSRGFYFPKNTTMAVAQAEIDRRNAGAQWGTYEIKTPDGFRYEIQGRDGTDAFNRLANALPSSPYMPRPVLVEFYTDEYRSLEDGVARGETQRVVTNQEHQFVLYAASGIDRQELARQVSDVQNTTESLVAELKAKKRAEYLPDMFTALFVPPLVLLAFGWVVLWVAAGFRSRQA